MPSATSGQLSPPMDSEAAAVAAAANVHLLPSLTCVSSTYFFFLFLILLQHLLVVALSAVN